MNDASKPHSECWDDALSIHLKTGDYIPLGIWAQDNVPGLQEQLKVTRSRIDELEAVLWSARECCARPAGVCFDPDVLREEPGV